MEPNEDSAKPAICLERRVAATIRPLDPETAAQVGIIELTERDFPFFIGRRRTHGTEGSRHLFGQDLLLADGRPYEVSRDHCALEIRDGEIVVNDRGSTLGTIVDQQILGRHTGVFVKPLSEGVHEMILGNFHSPHRFEVEVRPLERPGVS